MTSSHLVVKSHCHMQDLVDMSQILSHVCFSCLKVKPEIECRLPSTTLRHIPRVNDRGIDA